MSIIIENRLAYVRHLPEASARVMAFADREGDLIKRIEAIYNSLEALREEANSTVKAAGWTRADIAAAKTAARRPSGG